MALMVNESTGSELYIACFSEVFTFFILNDEASNFADTFTCKMGNSFLAYIQRLELLAFFSAYPLLYAVVVLLIDSLKKLKNTFIEKLDSPLPFAYALVGTLYVGLQIKNLYLLHTAGYMRQLMFHPFLTIWGLLSLLFWIPALSKKKVISLLHSLIFFFLLLKDIFYQSFGSSADREMLNNDVRIFTVSLLMNIGAFIIMTILFFIFFPYKKDLSAGK